jgi:hypothetical protein
MCRQPPEGGKIFGLDPNEWGIEQFSAGDDDDVDAVGNSMATEEFTGDTFGTVALDGLSDLSRGRHTKPWVLAVVRHEENREQLAPQLRSGLVGSLEFGALSHPLGAGQALSPEHALPIPRRPP